ncbi:hypothetical protein EJ05DRAFT_477364 [Pseudovirgaria hyperparasitica]|uniref:Uncharacterized protein n=1 Tax=Pseudovirgaria hyperparasitica TaxID=470096 RepID=A0A6A6W3K2_9PEZI|nr:uncharacterized protein EJ05DRAFT_477364 [Pseudovirgaria hyperparasitica]KAF2757145.1 hypothetical protein EJ05DRAFT_477364 [Pseudovirgaria hyperparasitica]
MAPALRMTRLIKESNTFFGEFFGALFESAAVQASFWVFDYCLSRKSAAWSWVVWYMVFFFLLGRWVMGLLVIV